MSSAVKRSILFYFGRQPTHGNNGHFYIMCNRGFIHY
ncbi:DUF1658 domain-containing protein [Coxiella endosymbiont of Ornithodoros amblus]|nr:DUF1658 domain-containing protein [Coxiella endosymbiont of Ornithodoros amblus]